MNREDIKSKIAQFNLKAETVYIPEWDSEVVIKELKGSDYLAVSENSTTNGLLDKTKFLTEAISRSVYIDNQLLFDETDKQSISELPASIYSVLVTWITKLNGIGEQKN